MVRYGATTAVDGLSFSVERGEVVALLGPNGAGKTSTLETLEGYRRPTSGSVFVLGLDPVTDHAAVVRRIGVMLQRGGVYPMLSSAQVLALFAAYYDDPARPEELLELVGLAGVARTPWRRLSGGEQQRLSLALALVGRPEVAFLDEPTAGVDPEGRLAVREVVASLRNRQSAVVLTTHELAEAERLADRLLIVTAGTLVASGTLEELAASRGDPVLRFGAPPGLDTEALGSAAGATVTEARPGEYEVAPPVSPRTTAALATWLAERDLSLTELRSGSSLEELYLSLVAEERTTRREAGREGSR